MTLMEAIEADESYGHAYAVLVSLLEEQDRRAEAAELRQAAENAVSLWPRTRFSKTKAWYSVALTKETWGS